MKKIKAEIQKKKKENDRILKDIYTFSKEEMKKINKDNTKNNIKKINGNLYKKLPLKEYIFLYLLLGYTIINAIRIPILLSFVQIIGVLGLIIYISKDEK